MFSGIANTLLFQPLFLLAQGDGAQSGGGNASSQAPSFFNPLNMFLLMAAALFFLLIVRPQRNEMKKLQQMLAQLKKNDRVVTRGGIHGVVIQTNGNDPTIVIRIDENTGARMTVNRDAVVSVLNADAEPTKKS